MKALISIFAIISFNSVGLFFTREYYPDICIQPVTTLKSNDCPVSSEFKKFGDGSGADIYIINQSGNSISVHWVLDDHTNVSSSGGLQGNEYITGYGYVLATTVRQQDPNQSWSASLSPYCQ